MILGATFIKESIWQIINCASVRASLSKQGPNLGSHDRNDESNGGVTHCGNQSVRCVDETTRNLRVLVDPITCTHTVVAVGNDESVIL